MLNKNQVNNIAYNMCQHAKLGAVRNITYDFDLRKLTTVRINMIKRAFRLGLNDTAGDTTAIVRSISEGLGIQLPNVPNGRDKYWGGSVWFYKDCGVDLEPMMQWASAVWRMTPRPESPYASYGLNLTDHGDSQAYFRIPKKAIPSNWKQRHALLSDLIVVSDEMRDKCDEAVKFLERGGIISLSFDEESETNFAETRYEVR